jgi:hypothetical protein
LIWDNLTRALAFGRTAARINRTNFGFIGVNSSGCAKTDGTKDRLSKTRLRKIKIADNFDNFILP